MYRIIVKKKAKKFIDKLPVNERKRIAYAIEQLPDGEDIKKIKGHDELLRLRVGEYRIIYSVDRQKNYTDSRIWTPQVFLRSFYLNFSGD